MEINEVDEVIKEFTEADNAIRKVFPKVDPLLVVKLIFDRKEGRTYLHFGEYPQIRAEY